jgi:hypothetical protein
MHARLWPSELTSRPGAVADAHCITNASCRSYGYGSKYAKNVVGCAALCIQLQRSVPLGASYRVDGTRRQVWRSCETQTSSPSHPFM